MRREGSKPTYNISKSTASKPEDGSREEGQKLRDILQICDAGRDGQGGSELCERNL